MHASGAHTSHVGQPQLDLWSRSLSDSWSVFVTLIYWDVVCLSGTQTTNAARRQITYNPRVQVHKAVFLHAAEQILLVTAAYFLIAVHEANTKLNWTCSST